MTEVCMSQINYAQIQPLIGQVDVQNRTVRVVFKCPITGEEVQSSATNRQSQSGVTSTVQRSLMYGVQNAISQTIRSVFGYSIFGRIAVETLPDKGFTTPNETHGTVYPILKRSRPLSLRSSRCHRVFILMHSETTGPQNAQKELLSTFDLQLQQAPVAHNYDRQLLTRMLVEIAMADGHLAQAEEAWLMSFEPK